MSDNGFSSFIKYSTVFTTFNKIFSLALTFYFFIDVNENAIVNFLSCVVGGYFVYFVLQLLGLFLIKHFVYTGTNDEFGEQVYTLKETGQLYVENDYKSQLDKAGNRELVIYIVDESEVIGNFKDAKIYEWIDVVMSEHTDTEPVRFYFIGTVNLTEYNLQPNQIAFEPGILYSTE